MPKFRFTFETEADDEEMAYMIARDSLGCFNVEEIPDEKPVPKCGNGPDVPIGFVRLGCEYDDNGFCFHCGKEIPF